MQSLSKTQKVTSIEEFKTYTGMDRFVVLPEGYETKIGLWTLINTITDQDTPDAFNMSHFAIEHKQISSYCDRVFSPLEIACNIFMIDFDDEVIVFDEYKDLEKYVADEFIDLEEAYTLYLTEEFLDQLIETDKEEKKAWCERKIAYSATEIKKYQNQIKTYEDLLKSI